MSIATKTGSGTLFLSASSPRLSGSDRGLLVLPHAQRSRSCSVLDRSATAALLSNINVSWTELTGLFIPNLQTP